MNSFSFETSFLKSLFCLSAIISIEKPVIHNNVPIKAGHPKATVASDVMAANPAAMVINTQQPPIVQVIRYHTN